MRSSTQFSALPATVGKLTDKVQMADRQVDKIMQHANHRFDEHCTNVSINFDPRIVALASS